jgi:hypothetical protein
MQEQGGTKGDKGQEMHDPVGCEWKTGNPFISSKSQG